MILNKKNPFYYLLLFAFLALPFTACDDDDDDNVVDPVEVAYVSLYHASPNAPSLDILMEDRQINYYPLQYNRYTGYLNFIAGERDMSVRPAGDANVIIDTTLTFTEGNAYSLFYVNRLANIEAMLVEDDFEIPAEGKAAVRFIHLSPDAPEVDLVRSEGDDDAGEAVGDAVGYREVTDFMTVDSGVQSFMVNIAGSEDEVLNIPDINLVSGGVYTIVARGFVEPPAGNERGLGAQILINY